jgi:phospholipase C
MPRPYLLPERDERGDTVAELTDAPSRLIDELAGTLDLGINYPLPTTNAMPSQETSPKRPPVP